ncbi:RNA 3'-terminal phosphate cyclase-like protein [Octopus bimaculoides]|uniref:RNA 3'-terminal phosphate cyclase domain-containing protein n=1 Tax=Octopus bimaculoides TaxID=37653 RepID=A0A0L8FYB2_OCTBM|nr:RNA 3'-terminal phosphate cyclase-like protein [Octopus bimaculoides]|eukprot:XP_014785786.1 PREDICTED: RNA 3'-terminal phosphate cyclase-like protein [Octopus bimaculoides]
MSGKKLLEYEGCNFFRQRLVLSILSGKSVRITKIRSRDDNPGLQEFELSFISLLEKLSNGSKVVINETGTTILFHPGMLSGGSFDHECNIGRALTYYIEPLFCLAPFAKKPLKVVLRGITHNLDDASVDHMKFSSLPVLKRFLGTDEDLELKITRRGPAPDGGGEAVFSCPCRQKLRPIQYTDPGRVKKIRGIAWCTKVSPGTLNRLMESAKDVLSEFIHDIYIHSDHCKGKECGKSPGFGLTLVAETTKGTFLAAEAISSPKGSDKGPSVAEDVGKKAAYLLLEEIYRGGCVDSLNQSMAALFMVLGSQDVSKLQIGQLTPYTIGVMRLIRDFFKVLFKVEEVKEEDSFDNEQLKTGDKRLLLTCVGVTYTNVSKPIL